MWKFIFITILVIWLLRKFGGFMFKRWVSKVTQTQGYKEYNFTRTSKRTQPKEEGEVYISKKAPPKGSKTEGMGDFVDYEEIE